MDIRSTLLCTALALLGAGASLAAPVDLPDGGADEAGWLTVYAPRVQRTPADGSNRGSSELVFITHRVSYAGLNLAVAADALELRRLIAEGAQIACEQLAALSPLADLDTTSCAREAIRGATGRADKLIAKAIVVEERE